MENEVKEILNSILETQKFILDSMKLEALKKHKLCGLDEINSKINEINETLCKLSRKTKNVNYKAVETYDDIKVKINDFSDSDLDKLGFIITSEENGKTFYSHDYNIHLPYGKHAKHFNFYIEMNRDNEIASLRLRDLKEHIDFSYVDIKNSDKTEKFNYTLAKLMNDALVELDKTGVIEYNSGSILKGN